MRVHVSLFRVLLLGVVGWLGCGDQDPVSSNKEELSTALTSVAKPAVVGLERAIEVQDRHTAGLLATQGVVGTAVGQGNSGGHVILVFTRAAGVAGVPASIEGVTVVPRVSGEIVALPKPDNPGGGKGGNGGEDPPAVDPTSRFDRPVPIGVSTGHPDITAGTIGARVIGAGGALFALSNNHVFANSNDAIATVPTGSSGDAVIQPGAFDGGSIANGDAIGTLYDFVPILFNGSPNTVDAAIVAVNFDNAVNDWTVGRSTPADGYGTPKAATVAASLNMSVVKYGRTTGQTKGRVQGLNAAVNVNYGAAGVALFTGQIIIGGGGFSSGGDSGSLVVVQKGGHARKAVGLLFAGGSGFTIANPIDDVLAEFGVTIDGE